MIRSMISGFGTRLMVSLVMTWGISTTFSTVMTCLLPVTTLDTFCSCLSTTFVLRTRGSWICTSDASW